MVDLRQSLEPSGPVTPLPMEEIAARAARRRRRRAVSVTATVVVVTAGLGTVALRALPQTRSDSAVVADAADPIPPTAGGQTSPGLEPDQQLTTPPATAADPTSDEASGTGTGPEATGTTRAQGDRADTGPTTTERTGSEPDDQVQPDAEPDDVAAPADRPATTAGLEVATTTTSSWEDGYCIEVAVDNGGGRTDGWQVVLDLEGTIATLWSATAIETEDGYLVFSGVAGYNATLAADARTTFGACLDVPAG